MSTVLMNDPVTLQVCLFAGVWDFRKGGYNVGSPEMSQEVLTVI